MKVVLKDHKGRGVAFDKTTVYIVYGAEVDEEIDPAKIRVLSTAEVQGRKVVIGIKE